LVPVPRSRFPPKRPAARAGLVWWQTQGTRVGCTITPEISLDPPPLTPTFSPSHFPIDISGYIYSNSTFSHCSTLHSAALNHHLGGFGPECARFGRGVPKSLRGRNRAKPGFGGARKRKPSVGDRHLGLCGYAIPT
jgi:hypothetical protein